LVRCVLGSESGREQNADSNRSCEGRQPGGSKQDSLRVSQVMDHVSIMDHATRHNFRDPLLETGSRHPGHACERRFQVKFVVLAKYGFVLPRA
jgi:hypothetical protein